MVQKFTENKFPIKKEQLAQFELKTNPIDNKRTLKMSTQFYIQISFEERTM
jgi:hypothetical protein